MPGRPRYCLLYELRHSESFRAESFKNKLAIYLKTWLHYTFVLIPCVVFVLVVTFVFKRSNRINLFYELARTLYRAFNDKKRAIELLERILKIDKYDYEANYFISTIYYENDEYELALKYFEVLLEINKDVEETMELVNWIRQNVEDVRVRFLCNRILDKHHGKK